MSDQCEKQKVGKHKKLFTQYKNELIITYYLLYVCRYEDAI